MKLGVGRRIREALFISFLATGAGCIGVVACNPTQKQVARTVVDLAPGGCVLITAVIPGEKDDQVCATVEELQPFVSHILAARKAAAAARASVAASAPVAGPSAAPAASK
jgi:hypothetical protein